MNHKSIFYASYPYIGNPFLIEERHWIGCLFLFLAKSVGRSVWPLLSLSALCGGAHAQSGPQIEALAQPYTEVQPVANGFTPLSFFRLVEEAVAKAIGFFRVENTSLAHNPKSSH